MERLTVQKFLLIAISGALGSLARYGVHSVVTHRMGASRFPYGTFLVNITACLIIGFSLTCIERRTAASPTWMILLPIGFVGAYSTFSTFQWETFSTLESGAFLLAAAYITLSVLLGLAAVWLGAVLARVAL
jgi:CrcB protein